MRPFLQTRARYVGGRRRRWHIQAVSPSWTERLGWSEAALTSRPWLEFVHPDDRVASIEQDYESRWKKKDGSWSWLSWRSVTYPAENLIYCAATDITHRKLSEEALVETEPPACADGR